MDLELQSVLEYGVAATAELLNQGFSDYFVPIRIGLEQFYGMLRYDSIDITSSRVVIREGKGVGAALIARRGWSSRLAGMAILPEARGQGVGRGLMSALIEEAKARGDRRMELEVIEQNNPAVCLYQNAGFSTLRRLISYRLDESQGVFVPVEEIDLRVMGRLISSFGISDIPWQISGETLAHFGPPFKAFRYQDAYVAISSPEAPQISLRSMLIMPAAHKLDQAEKLLKGLFMQFPEKTWVVPAIFPEEFGATFEKAGFQKEELAQFQMILAL